MIILGDDTLDGLGGAYRQAVEAASEAHGRLIGAVIASRDLGHRRLPAGPGCPGVGHEGAAVRSREASQEQAGVLPARVGETQKAAPRPGTSRVGASPTPSDLE